MAVNDVYRPNVDYTLAAQVTSPVSQKTAFIPSFTITSAVGTVLGVAGSPLVTSSSAPTGSTSLATGQATAATTAGGTLLVATRAGRAAVTITNLGTTDIYIGNTGVTTATGTLLTGTKGASITLPTSAAIYGIVGTGTQAVSFVETY